MSAFQVQDAPLDDSPPFCIITLACCAPPLRSNGKRVDGAAIEYAGAVLAATKTLFKSRAQIYYDANCTHTQIPAH